MKINKDVIEKNLKDAREILSENHTYCDVYYPFVYECLPIIAVNIEWGDWKHDHLCVDYILEEKGYKFVKKEITEEDGSDCFSAIHYYLMKGE